MILISQTDRPSMPSSNPPGNSRRSDVDAENVVPLGRGEFFAVDRRAWAKACSVGLNAAITYLVLARGSGGDNRTTAWSTNAVEQRTAMGRHRAKAALKALVDA